MASGVQIADDCKKSFTQELKMEKSHRYVMYKLSDDMKEIVVEKRAARDATYEDMVVDFNAAESKGECRYAIFDANYTTDQGNQKTKLVLFSWSPDTAKIKQKMVYASSKDAFKKAMGEGIGKEIQANDNGDLEWDCVVRNLKETDRN